MSFFFLFCFKDIETGSYQTSTVVILLFFLFLQTNPDPQSSRELQFFFFVLVFLCWTGGLDLFLSLRRRQQRRAFSEGMRNLAFNLLMSVFRRRLEVELLFLFFFSPFAVDAHGCFLAKVRKTDHVV